LQKAKNILIFWNLKSKNPGTEEGEKAVFS